MVPRAPTAAPRANLAGGTPVNPQTRHRGPLKPRENLCIAPAGYHIEQDLNRTQNVQ